MTPAEYIRRKKIYDVALTTEQVDRLSREFREASAWIVGQDEANTIKAYYDAAERIASGELSPAEARRAVREALAQAGYQADNPGSWGDLKDGTARQKLILDTNVKKAAGYAWHEAIKGSVSLPAQELVRMGARKQPRDWQARWREAYAALPPDEQAKASPTEMIALTDCAIWSKLSRWGDPYPPFDYGSGMDVLPVDADKARALGLYDGIGGETEADDYEEPDTFSAPRERREDIPDDVWDNLERWIKEQGA